ncbi:MAG: serine/threonine-protein kinase [Myxococcota bacterium]
MDGPSHDAPTVTTGGVATAAVGKSPAAVELTPGTRVGRYTIIELIGRGGMGAVYAANDPSLNRRVALKVLRPQAGNKERAAIRMLREAQALAQLSHPNVVQIFEVNTTDAPGETQVFLAMEFVDGPTLRGWATPDKTWRDAVEVFVQAGRGLVAAHERGLIHRDFKPGNVLVGLDGRVRVADFGLAKVDEHTRSRNPDDAERTTSAVDALNAEVTEFGTVIGTPSYMAPELHTGVVADESTDQYAFCVTLYEVLYGTRPFANEDPDSLRHAKWHKELQPVKTGRNVPPALRRIVLRGLSPDADDRWPSMPALLEALTALQGQRKRRVLTAAVFGGVLVSTGAVWASQNVEDPCARADEALEDVWSPERRDAVASGLQPRPELAGAVAVTLDAYAQAWSTSRVDACSAHQAGRQSAELLDRRMACLDEGLRALDAVARTLSEADAAVVFRASAVVASLPELARCDDADVMLASVPPPAVDQRELVDALRATLAFARAQLDAGRYGAARAEAADVVERAGDYAPVRAEAQLLLGRAEHLGKATQESAAALEAAYTTALAAGHDVVALEAASMLTMELGHVQRKPAAAKQWTPTVRALLNRLDASPIMRARALESLASSIRADEQEAAKALLDEALAIRRARTDEPLALANALNIYGNLLHDLEAFDESVAAFEETLTLLSASLSAPHPRLASVYKNMSMMLIDAQRHDDGLDAARKAHENYRDSLGRSHAATAEALAHLASTEMYSDREAAAKHFAEAIPLLADAEGLGADAQLRPMTNYGSLLMELGRHDEAHEVLTDAYARQSEALGADSDVAVFTLIVLGALEQARGNLPAARRYLDDAVTRTRGRGEGDTTEMLHPLRMLTEIAAAEGDRDAQMRHVQAALAIADAKLQGSPMSAYLHMLRADAHEAAEDWPAAVADYRIALPVAKKPEDVADLSERLAKALHGDDPGSTEARTLMRTAVGQYDEASMREKADAARAWLAANP